MKNVLVILFIGFNLNILSQCFNIESILVDACGNPEGENEMVVINVHQNLDVDNLVFDWPNNSFLSWCADASLTQQLNNTIVSSCGVLIEPPLNIVPANSKLLVVSSTNMLVNANSFDGLTDTLYIIYQCAGNTMGHFSNSANSLRYLNVSYNGACTQSETVSYLANSLPGSDGAAVFYDNLGNSTYYNTGCNAPVPTLNPNWSFPNEICNNFDILDLNNFLNPNTTLNGTWSGDIENNNFFNPENKLGFYSITYTVNDPNSCLLNTDSTIIIEVKEAEYKYDTISVCDSVLYKGIWFSEDTTLNLIVESGNIYSCDYTIVRTYKVLKAGFILFQDSVHLASGENFNFEIIGDDSYQYSFTNNVNDSCAFPCYSSTISPNDNGAYIIQVENEINSCISNLNLKVTIDYNPQLYVPNIFTPNNDGENDLFKIYGDDIKEIEFNIFSKWGELLFQGNSLLDYWDGAFNGKPLENGVYLLQIIAIGKDSSKLIKNQNIILQR